ncbi:beta-propeller fold lactonase family protein [Salinibacterium sp. UTAS2018]|uniref:lactonase family protein n=1 Tax=Salinibacterium sp. UTAS2018 TaxID=2508880 RepID=UPI001FEE94B3|nr:beta-propeller fold lactonase family protein [Salinibacterium sp. UTAS2018]
MTTPDVPVTASSTWLVGGFGPDMDCESEGISVMRSRADGSLEMSHLAAAMPSASFLVVDGDKVYSTLEGSGQVAVFDRDGETLSNVTIAASGGQYPCHITVSDSTVIAANYGTGTLGVLEARGSSAALETRQVLETAGLGPRPQQEGPHAHSSVFVDDNTLLSLDLGADRIRIFSFNDFVLEQVDEVVMPPGFGPRDIVARPDNLFYVLGELGCGFMVFEWRDRRLHKLCSIALPGAVEGDQASAIAISDDGRHAYVGVRHSNVIAILAIADDGRSVAPLTAISCEGNWPRHIILSDGILHVCNQFSNEIASFRIDDNGIPQLIAAPTRVLSPTYLARIA